MKQLSAFATILALLGSFAAFSGSALAAEPVHTTTGVGGYDLVAYQTDKRPVRGNGHNLSVHEGVTYLFASKANKQSFDANPAKYLPAYGGWCAFGVSVGKKFVGDPLVWRVVNGRLYLNLDAKIQQQWQKDIPGRIKTADSKWLKIRDKAASEL